MNKKATYLAYGLCLSPDFPLPFLPRSEAEVDLTIRFAGRVVPPAAPPPQAQISWQQEGEDWIWEYRDTEGIVCRCRFPAPGDALSISYSQPEMGDIFPILMGPGLGAALHLRGVALLHGAAVLLDGRAVLVSGDSGMGKSTLTAMLVAAGLPLLTEDLTPVDEAGGDFRIRPGYPRLQLHAEAVRGLGFALDECPPVYPGFPTDDKRWLDITLLPGGFHPAPTPLRLIYLLSGRRADLKTPHIKTLAPIQASLALLGNLYGTRWLKLPPQQTLGLCARLAERMQVRRVWTPEGLDHVAATAQALIADARATVA
jgi:hypothetical protein